YGVPNGMCLFPVTRNRRLEEAAEFASAAIGDVDVLLQRHHRRGSEYVCEQVSHVDVSGRWTCLPCAGDRCAMLTSAPAPGTGNRTIMRHIPSATICDALHWNVGSRKYRELLV